MQSPTENCPILIPLVVPLVIPLVIPLADFNSNSGSNAGCTFDCSCSPRKEADPRSWLQWISSGESRNASDSAVEMLLVDHQVRELWLCGC
jgi:hypothetical protein